MSIQTQPDPVVITTPEQVSFRLQPAGMMPRAMAWLTDGLIKIGLKIAVAVPLFWFGDFGIGLFLLTIFLVDFGYHTFFEARQKGQTPGKTVAGIRVVSAHGNALTLEQALLRSVFRLIDSLPATMTVGGLVAWLDPHNRRIGDWIAGTLVVADDPTPPPVAIPKGLTQTNSFAESPAIQSRILARITRQERDLWLDLMLRRDQLAPLNRAEVFKQAAEQCRRLYDLPDSLDHLSDEQTVLNVARIAQTNT